jgi:hypothetical protein
MGLAPVVSHSEPTAVIRRPEFSSAPVSRTELSLGAEQFLTPWSQTVNSLAVARARYTLRTGAFAGDVEARASNDPGLSVLANVRELNVNFANEALIVGRVAPESTWLTNLSALDRLNQRVCHSPMDCLRGGPIGLHGRWRWAMLSLSLVQLPDLSRVPSLDPSGRATSHNRWSTEPTQEVLLDGRRLPVRTGTAWPDAARYFFEPGLRLRLGDAGDEAPWTAWAALEPSRRPVPRYDRRLGFANLANGEPGLIITNEVTLAYPYEQIYGVRLRHALASELPLTAYLEAGTSRKPGAPGSPRWLEASSGFAGLGFGHAATFEARLGVGGLRQTSTDTGRVQSDPVLQGELRGQWGRWGGETLVQNLIARERRMLLLRPTARYAFTPAFQAYAGALLLAGDPDAPVYGEFRGNDLVEGGVRYVF